MSEEIPSAKLTSTELKIQPGEDIVFYDGICGLCNKLVQFVITYGGASKFLFCSLQSETAKNLLAKYGEDNTLAKSIIVITQYNKPASKMLKKAEAILYILEKCKLPGELVFALTMARLLPIALLNIYYDITASLRYKLFGRHESCLLRSQVIGGRFIDN